MINRLELGAVRVKNVENKFSYSRLSSHCVKKFPPTSINNFIQVEIMPRVGCLYFLHYFIDQLNFINKHMSAFFLQLLCLVCLYIYRYVYYIYRYTILCLASFLYFSLFRQRRRATEILKEKRHKSLRKASRGSQNYDSQYQILLYIGCPGYRWGKCFHLSCCWLLGLLINRMGEYVKITCGVVLIRNICTPMAVLLNENRN